MKYPCLLFICSLFTIHYSPAQDTSICYLRDENGRIREHNADFLKMILDVRFDTKQSKVSGEVKYEFRPIQYDMDTLFLNAPGIHIEKVSLNGKQEPFTTDSNGITIRFPEKLDWNKQYSLNINYEATPRKGLYFIGWNVNEISTGVPVDKTDKYFTRKQIWTQGQGIDNRHWIPCYDDVNDKLITETYITFDAEYRVVSNGVLKNIANNADGTSTWHYAMNKPMVPYLIMLAIDKYSYKDYVSKNGMVSRQYYYSDRPETVDPTYQYSAEMMDFLSNETGVPYPWETYSNIPVQDFMYGAMENTTATVYGDFFLNDARMNMERGYTAVNAHELTHQWFGDYITEYSGQHHWLHESFATYYSKQFMRHIMGEDYYQWNKRGEATAAINADKADRFPVAHTKGGSPRHYPKGSHVIDMIRYVVGDSVFKRSITNYLKKHAYDNVSNHDFMFAFMETAGVNLDWFFDEWVYRSGVPNYEVRYEKQADQVVFYVNQTHKTDELTGYFKMPIVFEIHFKDGSVAQKKALLSRVSDTVYVKTSPGNEIDFALFDPESNVLKTISFPKNFDELSAQATKATNMIDRYDALIAMRETSVDLKRNLLFSVYSKEPFNVMKTEIIAQLAKDRNPSTVELFKMALHDKDFVVRRSVIENLDDFPKEILADAEQLLEDSSYTTIETTLRKLCKVIPEKSGTYLERTRTIKGISNNVRIAWLELRALQPATDANNKFQKQLVEYVSNRYEFRTRVKAIEALEKVSYCDDMLVNNLFNASTYTNSRLANPAAKTLKSLMKVPKNREIATKVFEAHKWQPWEKKIIEPIMKG